MNQRPDFSEAKHKCHKLYETTITQFILELDGNCTLQPDPQLRLRQRTGSSTTIGSRIELGVLGEPHPRLRSMSLFLLLFLLSRESFRFLEIWLPGNGRGVQTDTQAARHIFSWTVVAQLSFQTWRTRVAQVIRCCASRNIYTSSLRAVSHASYTNHLHSVLSCSGSSILNPLRRSTTTSRWCFCGTTTSY